MKVTPSSPKTSPKKFKTDTESNTSFSPPNTKVKWVYQPPKPRPSPSINQFSKTNDIQIQESEFDSFKSDLYSNSNSPKLERKLQSLKQTKIIHKNREICRSSSEKLNFVIPPPNNNTSTFDFCPDTDTDTKNLQFQKSNSTETLQANTHNYKDAEPENLSSKGIESPRFNGPKRKLSEKITKKGEKNSSSILRSTYKEPLQLVRVHSRLEQQEIQKFYKKEEGLLPLPQLKQVSNKQKEELPNNNIKNAQKVQIILLELVERGEQKKNTIREDFNQMNFIKSEKGRLAISNVFLNPMAILFNRNKANNSINAGVKNSGGSKDRRQTSKKTSVLNSGKLASILNLKNK